MNTFIEKVKDGAIAAQRKYGVLASLTIAQAILETGWGKYSVGNNIFGIKASPSWTGGTVTCKTGEVYSGQAVAVSGTFRAYSSIEESIEDHAQLFVRNGCYHNLIGCTDYKQACRNVQADGYATDPQYADKLIAIIESNDLQQFDTVPVPTPVKPYVPSGNANIKAAQQFYNTHSAGLTVDGVYGPATRRAAIQCIQRGCNQTYGSFLMVDGAYGPMTEAAIRTLRRGDNNSAVYSLQAALMAHGYSVGGIDGVFGPKTESAVEAFQRDNGLTVDGLAGKKTFAALCK